MVTLNEKLAYKLIDFGARGVSSKESAGIGGLAHLINFMGTDTIEALIYGRKYYNMPMSGFSIPAMEHSTVTSWGKENEVEAYRNMLRNYGKPGFKFGVKLQINFRNKSGIKFESD